MEDKVPYIVHEGEVARLERTIKKLFILIIILIVVVFASNAIWLYEWNQYEYEDESISYEQDGEGTNVIGSGNEVKNEPKVDH